jgi:hypothetical protein
MASLQAQIANMLRKKGETPMKPSDFDPTQASRSSSEVQPTVGIESLKAFLPKKKKRKSGV